MKTKSDVLTVTIIYRWRALRPRFPPRPRGPAEVGSAKFTFTQKCKSVDLSSEWVVMLFTNPYKFTQNSLNIINFRRLPNIVKHCLHFVNCIVGRSRGRPGFSRNKRTKIRHVRHILEPFILSICKVRKYKKAKKATLVLRLISSFR